MQKKTYPRGGWAPRASSNAFKEVVLAACLAGAKAAAEAMMEARMAVFMVDCCCGGTLDVYSNKVVRRWMERSNVLLDVDACTAIISSLCSTIQSMQFVLPFSV